MFFRRAALKSRAFLCSKQTIASIELKSRQHTHAAVINSVICGGKRFIHTSNYFLHSKDDTESNSLSEEAELQTNARHKEFFDQFSNYLDALKTVELKPRKPDEFEKAADEKMASALTELFSKLKVEVTPELLEQRKMLREKYPAIFGKITDSDLDGPEQK